MRVKRFNVDDCTAAWLKKQLEIFSRFTGTSTPGPSSTDGDENGWGRQKMRLVKEGNLPVSVCIMVLNEEDRLERCLSRVNGFAEVVVLDTGSTDRSVAICREHGVDVHETRWEGYGKTRKKLFSLATQPWILWLDADELITDELAVELEALFAGPIGLDAFEINLIVYFQGKWVRHGDWFPGWHVRLFKGLLEHGGPGGARIPQD